MFKIVRRQNLLFFILALAAGIAIGVSLPKMFPDKVLEVPYLALFAGEIGLCLLLALLLYESASTFQAIRLACALLGFTMTIGAAVNVISQVTEMLPENFLLVSWVQVICMNVFGILACLGFFKLETTDQYKVVMGRAQSFGQTEPSAHEHAVRNVGPRSQALKEEDFTPPSVAEPQAQQRFQPPQAPEPEKEAQKADSARDILDKLNIGRINDLEKQLHPEQINLENLFKDQDQPVERKSSEENPDSIQLSDSLANYPMPGAAGSTEGAKSTESAGNVKSAQEAPLSNLFEKDIAEDIDKLFADIAPNPADASSSTARDTGTSEPVPTNGGAAAPQASGAPLASEAIALGGPVQSKQPPPAVKEELKEFARLSAMAKAIPRDQPVGTMRTIGKMLLDVRAVENIINSGESRGLNSRTAHVITTAQGQLIQDLLGKINKHPGVTGSLLIGYDGLVVATTVGEDFDSLGLGALTLAIYNHSNLVGKRLSKDALTQIVLKSANRLVILTGTSGGILAVFADAAKIDMLEDLLLALKSLNFA